MPDLDDGGSAPRGGDGVVGVEAVGTTKATNDGARIEDGEDHVLVVVEAGGVLGALGVPGGGGAGGGDGDGV
ncbi:MAG: hypothetical protein JXB32_12140 [Deltaproteobacteria bacterium]|nr:hypothetical protein [Deltaproteobacteria bacterium]